MKSYPQDSSAPDWIVGTIKSPSGSISIVSAALTNRDRRGSFRSRVSGFRMRYRVDPGLYAVGNPDENSPVLISANYKLSFDKLRSSLEDTNAYILVLDTNGINVWCAAGKGTFGTEELIARIKETDLGKLVRHRRIVAPQLGAPGIRAHVILKETGFRVSYGPVYARDLPQYLKNGFKATAEMRKVRFTLAERLVLIPMEISQIWKAFLLYTCAVLVLFGLQPNGILFREAVFGGYHFIFLGLLGIFTGSVLTPVLLPILPFRAFSLKGLVIGAAASLLYYLFVLKETTPGPWLVPVIFLLFPVISSYLALNFTGATPFTNMSGVKKEVKAAVPFYIAALGLSIILFIVYKLQIWGIL